MKKFLKLLPLVVVASLTACEKYQYVNNDKTPLLVFDTVVSVTMKVEKHFVGSQTYNGILNTLKIYDRLADPNRERTGETTSDYEKGSNVYNLNNTEEKTEISYEFYSMLERAKELKERLKYFNPLIGSLSNKWKISLNLNKNMDHVPALLSDDVIEEELEKMNATNLTIEKEEGAYKYYAQREGEGLIDLGAMAKGYALDMCLIYLKHHTGSTEDYLINAGNSSILLGENLQRNNKTFVVGVSENPKITIEASNSIISTSGISEQNVVIDGVTYSHIVNPVTGGAVSKYDQVTVIAPDTIGNGALGDALSTSLMMSTKDEIKEAETEFGVRVIAIKNGKIEYKSNDITLYN